MAVAEEYRIAKVDASAGYKFTIDASASVQLGSTINDEHVLRFAYVTVPPLVSISLAYIQFVPNNGATGSATFSVRAVNDTSRLVTGELGSVI